jgi:DNA-binding NarL/FixJ family response regulator
MEVVGAVQSAEYLRFAIVETDPDVVFLRLEPKSQETPWKELLGLGVATVLLVNEANPVDIEAAVAEGVQAILLGDVTGVELATAAVGAAYGLLTLSSDLANLVREGLAAHNPERTSNLPAEVPSLLNGFAEELTPRELEVLEMVSEGLSNKEIAALLNISIHTAKFHISSILGKLGASSRAEAASIGLRNGLITI